MASRWIVWGVIVATWLCFFRGPLFRDEVCAFRDAGNFYYPLFQWQCGEWAAGRVPLWIPAVDPNEPPEANPVACAFYPGKLLFVLPFRFAVRYNLFLSLHVLGAAAAMYCLARKWKHSETAAGIAALSYAFGGFVLFQYCNVIFLISAAWLPLAVWCAERSQARQSWRAAIGLGAVLGIMTLGGDPHMAYHVGIVATWYAGAMAFRERSQLGRGHRLLRRASLLALAAAVGLVVALPQIIPTVGWIRHSRRTDFVEPRSIYEAVQSGATLEQTARGWFGAPVPGSHAAQIYEFSQGPWRLAELAWPNVSGRMFPTYRRWLAVLPAEGGVWVPSLYLGLVPLVFALVGWRCANQRGRLARWLVLLGTIGSFGWYGVGWLLHESCAVLIGGDAPAAIAQPVGGLHWWAVLLLPGYSLFRYPAKWFVLAALGFSCLAARGCDRVLRRVRDQNDGRASRTGILSFFGFCRARINLSLTNPSDNLSISAAHSISLVLALIVFGNRSSLVEMFEHVRPDNVFGPLDATGAVRDVLGAFAHSIAVLGLLFVVLSRKLRQRAPWSAVGLLLLSAGDLAIANHWLVATVPADCFEEPTAPLRADPESARHWETTSSPSRLADFIRAERRQRAHYFRLERSP